MENKVKLVLILKGYNSLVGEVGKETILKDSEGTPLYIGDVVELTHRIHNDKKPSPLNFVCHDEEDGDYIMGIAMSTNSNKFHGEFVNWDVKKVQDFSVLKAGDCLGRVIVKES